VGDISNRFAAVAAGFTARVEAVPPAAWDNPAPCEGWVARDVVGHLVEWVAGPGFLLGAFGVETGPIPSVDDDPAGAWAVVRDAVQGALDDPEVATLVADCGPPGRGPTCGRGHRGCTSCRRRSPATCARATGLDERLDPGEVARLVAGFESLPPEVDEAMRSSGHYGPRVEVAAGADEQTRLLAFLGRAVS
jgi:hypothetical protein